MTKAGTRIPFTSHLSSSTPFVCLSTNQIDIDQPWTSYRNAGSPVHVVDTATYQDVNDTMVVSYPHDSGEEYSFDFKNIENMPEIYFFPLGLLEFTLPTKR